MNKLQKKFGEARICRQDTSWMNFKLRTGALFGIDEQGLFVSYAVPADKHCTEGKPKHIIIYRVWDTPVKKSFRLSAYGGKPLGSERRIILHGSGWYSSEENFRWYESQIPVNSVLGKKIIHARHIYKNSELNPKRDLYNK